MAVNNLDNYKNTDGFGMSLNIRRGNPNPLDNSYLWPSYTMAAEYAKNSPIAYVGQILTIVENGKVDTYVILNERGQLEKISKTTWGTFDE